MTDVMTLLPMPDELPVSVMSAQTDEQAAAIWVQIKGSRSPHTFESYRREAQRLLLWLREHNLDFRRMRVEDVHAFFTHLHDPPAHWVRKSRKLRQGEKPLPTQVLVGPMSTKSIARTRAILGWLFTYLQEAGYLQHNVFRLSVELPVVHTPFARKYLDQDAWNWFWQWIRGLADRKEFGPDEAARTRWVFALFYHTGLRIAEAAQAQMCHFVRQDKVWHLQVFGKGRKQAFVSVNTYLLRELTIYRQALGLPSFPTPDDQTPLIASLHEGRRLLPLGVRFIRKLITETARQAASECEDEHISAVLETLSPHTLRHTNATHRLLAGASLQTVQQELRHQSLRTTEIYAKATDEKRREDSEKFAQMARDRDEMV